MYKPLFGTDFISLVRFKDMNFEGAPDYEIEAEKIMHIALPIGKHGILMGSDTPEQFGIHNEMESRRKMFVSTESREEADALLN